MKGESGFLRRVQDILKSHGRLYYFLITVLSPVLINPYQKRKILSILRTFDETSIILNLGSGPTYYMNRKDIINVDLLPFKEVDIVADVTDLPVEDESVDLIINVAMLEHIPNPRTVVEEMYRVLKQGGKVISYLPFIVPFHSAPSDFHRWTIHGIKELFSGFHQLEISVGCGPTSGMLWVLQEWLSILLSFGNKTLHDVLFLTFMLFTAPVKMLDVFMVKFPNADRIASGFYVFGEKRKDIESC